MEIPVITGHRPASCVNKPSVYKRKRVLTAVRSHVNSDKLGPTSLPSIYLLNAAALSKPHAVEQLAADLSSYDTDVAIIYNRDSL